MGASINLSGPASVSVTAALIGDSVQSPPLSAGLPAYGSDGMPTLTNTVNPTTGLIVPVPVALELQSTLGSFLIPRMTLAQRNAMDAAGTSVDGSVVCLIGNVANPAQTGTWTFKQGGAWVQFNQIAPGGNLVGPGAPVVQNSIAFWQNTTNTLTGILQAELLGAAITYNTATHSVDIPQGFQILAAGTTALPVYSFAGNNTTGISSLGPNSIDFGIQAAEILSVQNQGAANCALAISAGNLEIQLEAFSDNAADNINIFMTPKGTGQFVVGPTTGTGATSGILTLASLSDETVQLTTIEALAVSYTLTLPTAVPADGQIVAVDAAGQLSFVAAPITATVFTTTGTITAAAFSNLATAPVQLLAAGGPTTAINVESLTLEFIVAGGSVAYTDGGPVIGQYGNAINAGGPECTGTIATATITNINAGTGSTFIQVVGFVGNPSITAVSIANQGIFLTAPTDFATGNIAVQFTIQYSYLTIV
jgi:hypothetical protein